MQTYLPYPDFKACAECLDDKRLGAMRRESKQCLDTLLMRPTKKGTPRIGYLNHPVLRWWRGFEDALRSYYNAMVAEWVNRGKNNNMEFEILPTKIQKPDWVGDEDFHSRHRSQLYHKNPLYYRRFNWDEAKQPLKPYLWGQHAKDTSTCTGSTQTRTRSSRVVY